MASPAYSIDEEAAVARLMHFLAIEGTTGKEKRIGKAVSEALRECGFSAKSIRIDKANEEIPLPTETGNLIVDLKGTHEGPRLLFMTHLDTVPLCAGAKPIRKGNRIRPEGATALGGDNRTGVACLVTLAATLLQRELPHPDLTLLFTVREESGLWGARHVDKADLGNPIAAYNIDGGHASELTIGAVGAERWQVDIHGQAAHAGVHPERGISATMVAAMALADVRKQGWFGKVKRDGKEGTSNIGSFGGKEGTSAGEATNVVTDYVHIKGEARSHDSKFVSTITNAYKQAFQAAAESVLDDRGKKAKVKFQTRRDYYPFCLDADSAVIAHARHAAGLMKMDTTLRITNGGLDANWMVRHGIPTLTFGAGQNNVHTVEEFVEISEFVKGCKFALSLATTQWGAGS